jgi:hypothetical protein
MPVVPAAPHSRCLAHPIAPSRALFCDKTIKAAADPPLPPPPPSLLPVQPLLCRAANFLERVHELTSARGLRCSCHGRRLRGGAGLKKADQSALHAWTCHMVPLYIQLQRSGGHWFMKAIESAIERRHNPWRRPRGLVKGGASLRLVGAAIVAGRQDLIVTVQDVTI